MVSEKEKKKFKKRLKKAIKRRLAFIDNPKIRKHISKMSSQELRRFVMPKEFLKESFRGKEAFIQIKKDEDEAFRKEHGFDRFTKSPPT